MNTTQLYPRPKPRFAGIEEVVFIAVEAVAEGLSRGEVGLIAGGVVLLFVALAVGGVVWWRRVRLRRARSDHTAISTTDGESHEMSSTPSVITPFAPTPTTYF